ncbi:MAG: NB-ARC domain-containing protein, partial [Chloroflexota bacterium]
MNERDRQDQESISQINSEGGAVTQGDVNVGGNYTGRDSHQTTIINNYYGTENPDEKPADPWEQFNNLPLDQIPERGDLASVSFFRLRKNQTFVGRREELQTIAQFIKEGDKTVAIAATGLGGIGKSQLAAEFCHRYGRYFAGGVFWLSFDNETSARTSLLESASHLNPAWGQLDAPDQIKRVQGPDGWQANIPRLLVFDNLEDPQLLEQYQPTVGGCRVLLTSRYGDWERSGLNVEPLPLETLLRPESIALVQKLASRLTDEEAGEIAQELADFPLALHLAGCFLSHYSMETPKIYLEKLRESDLINELDHQADRIEKNRLNPTNHTWHVSRTFLRSYLKLLPEDNDSVYESNIKSISQKILYVLSLLTPNHPIPIDLLLNANNLKLIEEHFLDEYSIQDALSLLSKIGLVQTSNFENKQKLITIHTLLSQFARNKLENFQLISN